MDELDPLDAKNPINRNSPLLIFVFDLHNEIGSDTFKLLPTTDYELSSANVPTLPTFNNIQENLHFISATNVSFNPNTYALSQGDYSSSLGGALLRQAELALSIAIVDEFYSYDKVVLDGLKRLTLKVGKTSISANYDHIVNLMNLIKWMYDDRVRTRKKLFNERLTLEINESITLLEALRSHINTAFEQARERYNFVILDRKDAYIKELKDLLKDLRAQSDLYSLKIRNLLNNFLRDVLATSVLIGFTIFTKFSDNIGLDKHKLLNYVFGGLSAYFILSILFQAAVDITDLIITNKELIYWKRASKELISEKEFNLHYNSSLKSRKRSIRILYPLIALLYVVISILCLLYPGFLNGLKINSP
ncbi:hypothetical protein [Pararcticibacter amylolyticus]|nr:hypothetical protein [Pararcticibacter amylolyticus]